MADEPIYEVIIQLDDAPEEANAAVEKLQQRGWGVERIKPPANLAYVKKTEGTLKDARTDLDECMSPTFKLLPSDDIKDILKGLGAHGYPGPTVVQVPSTAAGGAGTKTDKADQPAPKQDKPATPPPPPAGSAAMAHEGAAVLGVDDKLWDRLVPAEQKRLGASVVEDLYKARAAYARRVSWEFAADLDLLDRLEGEEQTRLVKRMLEQREGIGTHQQALAAKDVEMAEQNVELRKRDVQLADKGVLQQQEAVEMLKEVTKQAKKWTSLADMGRWVLLGTVSIAVLLIAWLFILVSAGTIKSGDVWLLPVVIFALAVFAASPAVLLLLERPLKGVDEWTPDGKASGDSGSGGASATGSAAGDADKAKKESAPAAAAKTGASTNSSG